MKSCPAVFSQQSLGMFCLTSPCPCSSAFAVPPPGLWDFRAQRSLVKQSPGTGADTVGRTMRHWGVMKQAGPQHLLIVTTCAHVRGTNGSQDTEAVTWSSDNNNKKKTKKKQASHLWEILEKGHGGCEKSPRGQLPIKDSPNRLNSCPVPMYAILHASGKKLRCSLTNTHLQVRHMPFI